jgi:alkanesulfonate monooxygenase SsuD/methylene tetrahydromethanopterin reductase-like flavin-dependent oxidoreductase (luciferase family)
MVAVGFDSSGHRGADVEGKPMAATPLHFNAFIWPHGYHESAWRLVDDDVRSVLGLAHYADIARTAEAGKLDAVFLADNIAMPEYRATYLPQTQFDPVSLLSALAAVTSRIGLIGTGSTTYSTPWELARRFGTLDHLSGGRAGWQPDALVGDRAAGVWADRGKLHAPRFHGRYYDVEGLLPFPLSPQGRPVLVQAGQSAAGVGLSARYADLVFSGPASLQAAVAFRRRLHAEVGAAGRDPDLVPVLPALMITLAGTEAEARDRARQLEELADPEFRWQNALFTAGLDPDAYDPDAPLPTELLSRSPGDSSRVEHLLAIARQHPGRSLRDVLRHVSGGAGQLHFIGTPEQLAAYILDWQDAGAADGFTILGSTLPYELRTFVDQVIPILQGRGRYRDDYAGSTLRDHLGPGRAG